MGKNSSDERLLGLVDAIYGAALEPDRWSEVIHSLREFMDLLGATIVYADATQSTGGVMVSSGLDPVAVAEYPDWVEHDVTLEASRRGPVGSTIYSAQIMPSADYRETVFYNEFLRRFGLYHVAGSKLIEGPSYLASLGIHRPESHPFRADDFRRWSLLRPHLSRAMQVHYRLSRARQREKEFADVLDRLRIGVVLLDRRGRVLLANEIARGYARSEDGFSIESSEVRGARVHDTSLVRQVVGQALRLRSSRDPFASGGMTSIQRPSGRRPYRVVVSPIGSGDVVIGTSEAAAIMFVTDPESEYAIPGEVIQVLFGLTPAESRVVARLAQGASTAQIAKGLKVKSATVREHLKSVFLKTGTGSQIELLERVHTVVPPIRMTV